MKTKMCILVCMIFGVLGARAVERTQIDKGWRVRSVRVDVWHPATVPGVIHTDLMAAGSIEDPFFGLNERGVQWVDKEDWIYQTSFDVPPAIFAKENIRLVFKGLDTYAQVTLNGDTILSADNMFRTWTVDVKGRLKEKGNTLRIVFSSPIRVDMPKWEALPFQYDSGNDQSENGGVFDRKVGIFARKAGYHYGWDWGPRLVTSGIWRPIELEGWSGARIENVQVIQQEVGAARAVIKTIVEIQADKEMPSARVTLSEGGRTLGSAAANLKKGMNRVEVDFTMKKPRLWWSHGLGEPYLYDFQTSLSDSGRQIDSQTDKIGIRSIEVVREKDEHGRSMYFVLNGVPVFAKGANYIPCDSFLSRITKETYKKTVLDAVNANMNMLRVWGGGIYEDDYFYELCDRYGILVWQDFMFACALYPSEGALLENIRQEAIDNVKRLRNHSSIAIWCGNNECQDAWFGWGLKRRYERQDPRIAELLWKQFTDLYYVALPEVVEQYGSGIAYTPSSPFADYGVKSNDREGDRHYWEIWHGKKPISDYNIEKSRFFSEYGFQSFPELGTVKKYAPDPKDWDIRSEVMLSHQRGGAHANGLIESYLLAEYRTPVDFPSFLYMNHILQGDAIRTAMEAHRRAMPVCMGTLFWQHNDCWPVASWSSRDYYGRWKAVHYYARKAYDNVLVSPVEEQGKMAVYAVSDLQKGFDADLTVRAMLMDGTLLKQYGRRVKVAANTSTNIFNEPLDALMSGHPKGDVIVSVALGMKDGTQRTNVFYAVKQKEMNYPKTTISRSVRAAEGGVEVTLSSDKFARGVYVAIDDTDNFFSDNYFDLLPGQSVSVRVKTKLTPAQFEKQLSVVSLSDAY